MSTWSRSVEQWGTWMAAVLGPAIVTAVLVNFSHQVQRDYVFIYLGLVAVVGVVRGLWPALACAAISFLLVDRQPHHLPGHRRRGGFARVTEATDAAGVGSADAPAARR